MSNITAAQKAKAEKALSQLIRHEGVVMTKRAFLGALKREGGRAEITMVPELEYSRTKYNRMSGPEQDIYERRCTEKTKQDYRIYVGSVSFFSVSKTEYDCFLLIPETELQPA